MKFNMTDPILGYPDEDGHADPIVETQMFAVSPTMAVPVPIGDDGQPIYLGDDKRKPRALTPRFEIFRLLNPPVDPATIPAAEKLKCAEISAEVLSHRLATFQDGWATIIWEKAEVGCPAVVLRWLQPFLFPTEPEAASEGDDGTTEVADPPKPKRTRKGGHA